MIWWLLVLSILMIPVYKTFINKESKRETSDIVKEAEDILRNSSGGNKNGKT